MNKKKINLFLLKPIRNKILVSALAVSLISAGGLFISSQNSSLNNNYISNNSVLSSSPATNCKVTSKENTKVTNFSKVTTTTNTKTYYDFSNGLGKYTTVTKTNVDKTTTKTTKKTVTLEENDSSSNTKTTNSNTANTENVSVNPSSTNVNEQGTTENTTSSNVIGNNATSNNVAANSTVTNNVATNGVTSNKNVNTQSAKVTNYKTSNTKADYLNELDGLTNQANNLTNGNENNTQYQMNESSIKIYTLWNNELNQIYSNLEQNLTSEQMAKLQKDEIEWINYKEQVAQNVGQQYPDASIAQCLVNTKLANLTKERCYYLVNTYM